jgi:uncharacterized secreted protein with C-terminal beta-propeller domain
LNPYDENHIIGVGRDENNSVKVSLFDVSNVSAPVEIDMHSVGGVWSDTLVLTEHKAFLFEKSKNLLAFPVSVTYLREEIYPYPYYQNWQGVYVFNITLSDGLVLRGNITHQDDGVYYLGSYSGAKRVLYIENMLYTISDMKVKLSSLEDLVLIKEIELG